MNITALNKAARGLRRKINIMEVCGTHTNAIAASGLKSVLDKNINLISGPGCPVCVSGGEDLFRAVSLAREGNIICTFADMLRVPDMLGNTLNAAASAGAEVRVIYSPSDALALARKTKRNVILLAAGFETTAPAIASVILEADRLKIKNFFAYPLLKLITPAIKTLLDGENKIDAFLLPGHVSLVLGLEPYAFIARRYKKPGVVGGFTGGEITDALYKIVLQRAAGAAKTENAYPPVKENGNPRAREIMFEVFTPADAVWRGLGKIKNSGLKIKKEFGRFDALKNFSFPRAPSPIKNSGCRCGEVLSGLITPEDCGLFGKKCAPENPLGPCMVSREGACHAGYVYKK